MILHTTLALAAAAAFINIWHVSRIGKVRMAEKIIHGDGGNPLLMQRMRAQLNFVENTLLVLILIAAIDISGKGGMWLPIWGGVFMLARVAHAIGMDSAGANKLRMIGTIVTILTQLGLAIVAIVIAKGML